MNEQKVILWSTNVSNITSNTTTKAQLLNTRNLVLQENTTGRILWQSFQHPTNTLLQGMELSTNKITGERVKVTSWKTPQDPSIGDFSLSLEGLIPEEFISRGSQPHWRSGPWNDRVFIGIPAMNSNYLEGFYLDRGDQASDVYSLYYNYPNKLMMYTLTVDGNFHQSYWNDAKRKWFRDWSALQSDCDIYGKCGAFGSCDSTSSPICSCLRGYEPRNVEEWNRQNWSSGCVRKQPLQCERVTNGSDSGKGDGFLKLQNAKVPNFAQWSSPIDHDCRTQCLRNCSCIAYAYDPGIGCMLWTGNLIDIQIFSMGGTDLYIRVPYSELDKKNNRVIMTVVVIIGTVLILASVYILWKRTRKGVKTFLRIQSRRYINDVSEVQLPEYSLFKFEKLATATNNFHFANKLGQGGFGSVYKDILEDGQEIVVKRLSKASGQGLEEFMNEVLAISKLQQRNLVKLLGCCIEGNENILIYEYLPNTSLVHIYLIISGKKIQIFMKMLNLSLLGYVWKLWNADNIASLIDPKISNSSNHPDITRCIHIGLLCVQELAKDRPAMTTIISMLNSEIFNLPPPSQPAFMHRQAMLDVAESSLRSDGLWSINYVSLTNVQGR